MNKVKKFTKGTRFRVISGRTCFYTTAGMIRAGVGDFMDFNKALQESLKSLEDARKYGGPIMGACVGHSGFWNGFDIQLNMAQNP